MVKSEQLTLLACQLEVPAMTLPQQRDAHLQAAADAVSSRLDETPVDVVILPELSSLHYSRATFENLEQLAEPQTGVSFQTWRVIALRHDCWVVYGFAHRHRDGISIAAGVVAPTGEPAGVYHKLHLAQFGDSMEKEYFTAGQQLLVFKIGAFTLAPVICYDIRAPELCRTLVVDHGVNCLLHTSAYARDASFDSWHTFVTARAMENQCYVLSLNRAGSHFGSSIFCPPWVDQQHPPLLFDPCKPQFVKMVLSLDELTSVRKEYSFLQDKLADYALPAIRYGD